MTASGTGPEEEEEGSNKKDDLSGFNFANVHVSKLGMRLDINIMHYV